jgi:hypothetical protein
VGANGEELKILWSSNEAVEIQHNPSGVGCTDTNIEYDITILDENICGILGATGPETLDSLTDVNVSNATGSSGNISSLITYNNGIWESTTTPFVETITVGSNNLKYPLELVCFNLDSPSISSMVGNIINFSVGGTVLFGEEQNIMRVGSEITNQSGFTRVWNVKWEGDYGATRNSIKGYITKNGNLTDYYALQSSTAALATDGQCGSASVELLNNEYIQLLFDSADAFTATKIKIYINEIG